MLIDSVIIRLIKSGVGIGPDYSISIYGNGKVLYEGVEKVKVKGIVESFIDNDKLLSLLEEFKEKGFFTLSESYGEEDANIRPCTKISISFQKKDGKTVAKKVRYCNKDVNAPRELVELEDKIEEVVGTSKWVVIPPEYKEKEKQKIVKSIDHLESEKPHKKKTSRLIVISAAIAIVAMIIIFFAFYSGIFNQPSQETNSSDETNINYLTPEITVLKPASEIRKFRDYDNETIFNKTQNISIYEEYVNISTINNETCDLTLDLIIEDMNTSTIRHVNYTRKTEIGNCSQGWYFVPGEDWPSGGYYAITSLRDNISNTTATKTTFFVLLDV